MALPLLTSTKVAAPFPNHETSGHACPGATSDHGNRVRGAAVDFNEGDQTLSIFSVRIVDAELLQPQHRKPDTKHLPGTKVPVRLFGIVEIFVEDFTSSAVSFQLSAYTSTIISCASARRLL